MSETGFVDERSHGGALGYRLRFAAQATQPMQADSSNNPSRTAPNVTWHDGQVLRVDRERLLQQRGAVVWLTGLSGSGKSTIAVAVEVMLTHAGRLCYRIDGDNLRHGLNRDLAFSREDRSENVRRTGEVCRIVADTGAIVLASLVSPFAADRDKVRALHDEWGIPFLEVFVDVPLAVAQTRDPKGLYRKAAAGEIRDLTGVHQAYEAPPAPELVLHSDQCSVEQLAITVIDALRARSIVK